MQEGNKAPNNVEGLRALYAGVLQNLHMIQYADYATEAKLSAVLAADLLILILTLENMDGHHWAYAGLVPLLASLFAAIIGLWPRTYYTAAVRVKDNQADLVKPNRELLLQLVIDADNVCDKTSFELQRKNAYCTWAVVLFLVGTLLSFSLIYIKI